MGIFKLKLTTFIMVAGLTLSAVGPATADRWNTEEKVLESIWLVAHYIDWRQTRTIAKHPELYHELGVAYFILGDHPDCNSVDLLFLGGTLAHLLVTDQLHRETRFLGSTWHPRRLWQMCTISVSTNYVIINFQVNISLD